MQHFKDLDACIAQLRTLQARSDIGPEQKKHVETAIKEAKHLRRRRADDSAVVYWSVRRTAECLVKAFLK